MVILHILASKKETVLLHPAQMTRIVAVYLTAAALGSAKHTRGPVTLPARSNLTVEVRYLIAAMVNAKSKDLVLQIPKNLVTSPS